MVKIVTLYKNGMFYTPEGIIEHGEMLVDSEGFIQAIGEQLNLPENRIEVDLKGQKVLPGFIDVHVHGGNGAEVMAGTYEDLNAMSLFHAQYGTTSFLAGTA